MVLGGGGTFKRWGLVGRNLVFESTTLRGICVVISGLQVVLGGVSCYKVKPPHMLAIFGT
jgi:hypothetical protein